MFVTRFGSPPRSCKGWAAAGLKVRAVTCATAAAVECQFRECSECELTPLFVPEMECSGRDPLRR